MALQSSQSQPVFDGDVHVLRQRRFITLRAGSESRLGIRATSGLTGATVRSPPSDVPSSDMLSAGVSPFCWQFCPSNFSLKAS